MVGDGAQDVNRVYFGTDTRVQALLVGAAAAALLVRDWSALTMSGTLIRTRWRGWSARPTARRSQPAGSPGKTWTIWSDWESPQGACYASARPLVRRWKRG